MLWKKPYTQKPRGIRAALNWAVGYIHSVRHRFCFFFLSSFFFDGSRIRVSLNMHLRVGQERIWTRQDSAFVREVCQERGNVTLRLQRWSGADFCLPWGVDSSPFSFLFFLFRADWKRDARFESIDDIGDAEWLILKLCFLNVSADHTIRLKEQNIIFQWDSSVKLSFAF